MATKTKGGAAKAKAASKAASAAEAIEDTRVSEQKEQQAATGRPFPESEANTLNEHAVPASEIAAAVEGGKDDGKKSGAAANAASMDAASEQLEAKTAEAQKQEDNSIFGKIKRSGLFFVREHITGQEYVGISPQANPDAAWSSKHNAAVFGLDTISPRTGMEVRPKDGEPFRIGDGFGMDSKPTDWAAVMNGDRPLFA